MSAISVRVEDPRTRRRVRRHRQTRLVPRHRRRVRFRTSPAVRSLPRSDALSCSGLSHFRSIRFALFLYNSLSPRKTIVFRRMPLRPGRSQAMQGMPRMALTRAVMNRVAPTRQVLIRLVPAIISAALVLCLSLLVWAEGAAGGSKAPSVRLPGPAFNALEPSRPITFAGTSVISLTICSKAAVRDSAAEILPPNILQPSSPSTDSSPPAIMALTCKRCRWSELRLCRKLRFLSCLSAARP